MSLIYLYLCFFFISLNRKLCREIHANRCQSVLMLAHVGEIILISCHIVVLREWDFGFRAGALDAANSRVLWCVAVGRREGKVSISHLAFLRTRSTKINRYARPPPVQIASLTRRRFQTFNQNVTSENAFWPIWRPRLVQNELAFGWNWITQQPKSRTDPLSLAKVAKGRKC